MTISQAAAPEGGRVFWRTMVITHRYLGVAVGLLMLIWFLSGIVMMYVPYPQRSETERVSALAPIAWESCCNFAGISLADDAELTRVQLENVAGRSVLRLRQAGGPVITADAGAGRAFEVGEAEARAIGRESAMRLLAPGTDLISVEKIEYDQWTIGDNGVGRRPVYRLAFDDEDHTRLYASAVTGEVIVWTTRSQRFWNWLGAIPHWLYFSELRKNTYAWGQIIIWTSILGTFLTVIGLYLGIARFKKSKSGRWSPYSGWFYWHHLIGLAFGIVTLTWVLSGLFSMQPWGFLESRGGDAASRLAGNMPRWGAVRTSLETMQAQAPADIASLTALSLDGKLYWLARYNDGRVVRFDAAGSPSASTEAELSAAATRLAGGTPIAYAGLMADEDAYYFEFHGFAEREPLVLPVYRVILDDAENTRVYLDPRNGRLLGAVDSAGRGFRWLFGGLHRFDFTAWLRTRPVWDIVVLFLMLGGTASMITGVYLALRRIGLDVKPRPRRMDGG